MSLLAQIPTGSTLQRDLPDVSPRPNETRRAPELRSVIPAHRPRRVVHRRERRLARDHFSFHRPGRGNVWLYWRVDRLAHVEGSQETDTPESGMVCKRAILRPVSRLQTGLLAREPLLGLDRPSKDRCRLRMKWGREALHQTCTAGEINLRDCVMLVGAGGVSAAGESDVGGWSYHDSQRREEIEQGHDLIMW